MNALEIDVVYENGALKLPRELPIPDGQKVRITIHAMGSAVQRLVGSVAWPGSVEDLDTLIHSEDNDPLEAS